MMNFAQIPLLSTTGFNPLNMGNLELWLDAADSSTITTATGVSQWSDKSLNGRHAVQATGTNQPSYQSAVQNGLNVVRFDGSNDYFTVGSITDWTFLHFQQYSVYIVLSVGTVADPNALYILLTTNSQSTGNPGFVLSWDDRASVPRNESFTHFTSSGIEAVLGTDIVNGFLAPQTFALIFAGGNNTASVPDRAFMSKNDGAFTAGNTNTGTATSANAFQNLYLGQRGNGTFFAKADICEILIYSELHRDGKAVKRNSIAQYLMQKWGL